jgi:hypothetical protein
MPAYPAQAKTDKEQEAKWRAESDLRSLVEAEEIRKDKGRMAAALKCAREKMAAMKEIKAA